jgi:hypothetical protein
VTSPPVVLLDACVLYPAPLRDLLMWLGNNGLIAARWSSKILEEWVENLLENRPDLQRERLARTCSEMNRAIPDALVPDYESIIQDVSLPDVDDRHVLAAAIVAGAEVILTLNLKDFPKSALPPAIQAIAPDAFLSQLFDEFPESFLSTMQEHRRTLRKPSKTAEQYLATLAASGLSELVRKAGAFKDSI